MQKQKTDRENEKQHLPSRGGLSDQDQRLTGAIAGEAKQHVRDGQPNRGPERRNDSPGGRSSENRSKRQKD